MWFAHNDLNPEFLKMLWLENKQTKMSRLMTPSVCVSTSNHIRVQRSFAGVTFNGSTWRWWLCNTLLYWLQKQNALPTGLSNTYFAIGQEAPFQWDAQEWNPAIINATRDACFQGSQCPSLEWSLPVTAQQQVLVRTVPPACAVLIQVWHANEPG